MAKPIDKTDSITQKRYEALDAPGLDEQYKRSEKRAWKKKRTRHIRSLAKKELRDRESDL